LESRQTWEKQLCMTGLRVTHARYEREHHCDAGDGAATQLPITISVTASTTWADVATYYTPKLTGNTTSITAATVTFRIASSAAAAEYPNP